MVLKRYVNIDSGGNTKLINLPDPSAAQDVATKSYVDNRSWLVGRASGPPTTTDYPSTGATVFTLAVNLTANFIYKVILSVNYAQLVNANLTATQYCRVYATDSLALIPGTGTSGRLYCIIANNMQRGTFWSESITKTIAPTSSGTDTFTVSGQSDGGAIELLANQCELIIERIA